MNAFQNESKATLGRIGRSDFNFAELMHECHAFQNESKASLGRIGRSVFNFVELMHECLPQRKQSDTGPHWS
jgi:hypothetical protein